MKFILKDFQDREVARFSTPDADYQGQRILTYKNVLYIVVDDTIDRACNPVKIARQAASPFWLYDHDLISL